MSGDPLADFEHVTLQPGEVLVLRPKRPLSLSEQERCNEKLKAAGFRSFVVVPSDWDVIRVTPPEAPHE